MSEKNQFKKDQSDNLTKTTEKAQPKAFVNWSIPTKDGKEFKSTRGFAIFQNPDFKNKGEDILLALAVDNGGRVELDMKVVVEAYNGPVDINNIVQNIVTKTE